MKWMTKSSIIATVAFTVASALTAGIPCHAASAQQGVQKKLAAIESVSPSGEGSATELVIKLSSPATYTSYKTTSPLRLVIDFSQVTQGALSDPIVINQGNFKSVTASRFDTDAGALTRLDIELVQDSEAVLSASPANPGELKVAFPSLSDNVPATSEKTVTSTPVVDSVSTPAATTAAVTQRTLTAITAQNNTVQLVFDGPVPEFKTFRLNKPDRFVIDLVDVKSGLSARFLPLNAAGVASARVGLYPDKVRVVLDSVNGSFSETSAVKTDTGIVITLNTTLSAPRSEPVPDTAAAKSDDKPVAQKDAENGPSEVKQESLKAVPGAAKPSGTATVEMIDFQVVNGISRVSVKVRGDMAPEQPVKSAGFVTLTIKNAVLPKKLQRSIETRAFISPVLRITPLTVKTRKGINTKIRIAMRVSAPFEFRLEGDMLFIDFKNPEGLTADKLLIDSAVRPKTSMDTEETISSELAPAVESSAKPVSTGRSYKGRKVTLEFADAEVRKIFQLLSEVSNKNFVLGDDVTGAISLKLVNVPWDQALDIILDTKGLDKREEGNIILIKGKGKFKSQAEEEQEIKKALTRSIELKTETFSVNYADIATISGQFNGLKTDRGTIAQDARTNKVIVKDIPQALDDMRNLLVQLDVPEKQVMIEARIVEASSTFTRNLGVNWGVHFRDGSASFLGINSLDTGFGGLTSAPPTSGTGTNAGGSMGISFGTLSSNIQLDMRLNAAASAGMVKIVSTPKVATLNNKTAKITQGQQIPYTSSTSDKVETKFIEAALSLEVTPHINANGTIGMKIDAKNDSPGQATGSGAPAINKKQATTEMLLRDGETTVIGGIYVDSDNTSDDGVPYLMDIPFFGTLFKTNNKTKTKTELLIFITPRILGTI